MAKRSPARRSRSATSPSVASARRTRPIPCSIARSSSPRSRSTRAPHAGRGIPQGQQGAARPEQRVCVRRPELCIGPAGLGAVMVVEAWRAGRADGESEKAAMVAIAADLGAIFTTACRPERRGLYLVSSNAGFASSLTFWEGAVREGVAFAGPGLFPWTLSNAPCGWLAREFELRGPNLTHTGRADALGASLHQCRQDLDDQAGRGCLDCRCRLRAGVAPPHVVRGHAHIARRRSGCVGTQPRDRARDAGTGIDRARPLAGRRGARRLRHVLGWPHDMDRAGRGHFSIRSPRATHSFQPPFNAFAPVIPSPARSTAARAAVISLAHAQ